MRILLFVFILLIGSASLSAADKNGAAAVKGAGRVQCQAFNTVVAEQSQQALQIVGWMEGFITGINVLQNNTFDMAPWQSSAYLGTLLQRYCSQFPEEAVHSVVLKIVQTFSPIRLTDESELIRVGEGEQAVIIYKEVLRRLQTILIDQAYLSGSADGIYGPNTQRAITAYQRDANLPQNGLPDLGTLQYAFVVQPTQNAQQEAQGQP